MSNLERNIGKRTQAFWICFQSQILEGAQVPDRARAPDTSRSDASEIFYSSQLKIF